MASMPTITRRAAIAGALASSAALAVPGATAAATGTTLEELALEFKRAAMALDPTITGAWIMKDEMMDGPGDMRTSAVYLERPHSPFIRPAAPSPSPVERAIEAHRKAFAEYSDACDISDKMHPRYGGEEAEAVTNRLGHLEQQTLTTLCEMPARGADARKRAAYLLDVHDRDPWLIEKEQLLAAMRSMTEVSA